MGLGFSQALQSKTALEVSQTIYKCIWKVYSKACYVLVLDTVLAILREIKNKVLNVFQTGIEVERFWLH